MKNHKKLFSLLLVLCLMFSMAGNAFAASYTGDDVKPGLSGIQPSDELTHPENTDWATLTASWGVRVRFVDWDESELKSEVVPVTDTTLGNSAAPADPTRSGYTFMGWERHDTTSGTATLNDDGTVTGVNGPGPIVFIAKYNKLLMGNLVVSKIISGNAADKNQEFSFTVTLSDASVKGSYGDMTFTNGVATFTLKGGESKSAIGIPAGLNYTVTEVDCSKDGYITTKSGDKGTIQDGKTSKAVFTNTKNTIQPSPKPSNPPKKPNPYGSPKTGDSADLSFWILLLTISAAGFVGVVMYRKKLKINNSVSTVKQLPGEKNEK